MKLGLPLFTLGALAFTPPAIAMEAGGGNAEICDNGIDDDNDNATDCVDTDCVQSPACVEVEAGDFCGDGVDNDGDGVSDCDDAGCADHYLCTEQLCFDNGPINTYFFLAIELRDGTLKSVRCSNNKGTVNCDTNGVGPTGRPLLALGPPMCGGAE